MKNKKITTIIAVLLVAVLGFGAVAFATGSVSDRGVPTVTYDAEADVFKLNKEFQAVAGTEEPEIENGFQQADKAEDLYAYFGNQHVDLFTDLKNMMPGDSVSQNIRIRATKLGNKIVKLYLIAEGTNDIKDTMTDDKAVQPLYVESAADGDSAGSGDSTAETPGYPVYNDAYEKLMNCVTVTIDNGNEDNTDDTYT